MEINIDVVLKKCSICKEKEEYLKAMMEIKQENGTIYICRNCLANAISIMDKLDDDSAINYFKQYGLR